MSKTHGGKGDRPRPIDRSHVREYTNTGHKGLSPLAIVRKLNKLEKENAELRKLIYKCKSLMHARSSFEAYEIWEEVEEKLKEQGE